MVASNVTPGNASCNARASLSPCVGPLKKSGSPKETCVAPSLTCCAMSSSTTSTGTMRNLPWYTGTTGQCRHRCLQPRLPSAKPRRGWIRPAAPGGRSARVAGRPLRSGTSNAILPSLTTGSLWAGSVPHSAAAASIRPQSLANRQQRRLHLPAQHGAHAQSAQQRLVHGRVEPVDAEVRVRGESPWMRGRASTAMRVAVCMPT